MDPDLDLDHLDALASAVSPGPWKARETTLLDRDDYSVIASDFGHSCGDVRSPEDAAFMVAARQAVPALVARARALEAETETETASLRGGRDEIPDLDHLDALANAASPGPWKTHGVDLRDRDGNDLLWSHFECETGELERPADAAFVAAARQAVPVLLARVRKLEAEKRDILRSPTARPENPR